MIKIYLYTPNQHQDKIQDLEKIMDKISDKAGYPVLEIGSAGDIKDTSKYLDNNRKVVIFDDLVNAPAKIQNKIANHFTDGRNHKISPIYLTQSYYDVPPKFRNNCSRMILYPPPTKNHLNLIAKENLIEPSLFNKLGPYEFLFLDKENKNVKKHFAEVVLSINIMGIFNNLDKYSNVDISEFIKSITNQTNSSRWTQVGCE